MNNYHICEIGRSKNSVVYKGRLKKTIEYLAIKSSEKIHKAKVMNEVRILENTSHENIVEFYGFHKTRNHLWVVLEYCPGGDILTLIDQDKHLPESVIKDFGLNIMDGLFYLHSKQIIYADLKPSNILFNEYGVLKLCDFGLARLISDAQTEDSKKGTPYYMAPELFEEGGVYSYYSDLWSLGCVLYELAVGTPPFVSNTFKDLKDQILNAETPYILGASDAFNDLISGLLQKDPSKRMGWEEILWHEFWDGKRLIQVNLPSHPSYEQYLKSKGLVQRTNGYKNFLYSYDNKKFEARESIRTSFNGKEDFVIKNRDQVFNFGENWDFEEKSEEAKVVHQRSNSAALQTPAAKNNFKPQPVDQLLLHNTDTIVKPIINSYESLLNTIEINLTRWYPEDITDQVNSPELESHLSEVYTILNSSSPVGTKISYLLYLESLIIDFPIANKLINSGFVELFLKISKSSELKSRICSLFGQMLRHATIIDSDLPRSSISDYFIKIINEDAKTQTEILIKRKALAALGEYLFFAATQMDEEEYDVAWEIDKKIVNILTHEASLNQDEVCRLYAVRTIENITAQSKNGGVIFALAEVVLSLCNVVISCSGDDIKLSALAALSHIVRLNTPLAVNLFNIITPRHFYQTLKEADERSQQALISIVCYSLQSKEPVEINIPVLVNLLESPGIVIRGKTVLTFMFLLKNSTGYLLDLVPTRFFLLLDRLLKDNYKYVQFCLHYLLETLADKTITILRLATENNFNYFSVLPFIFNSLSGHMKLPFPVFIKYVSSLLLKDLPETSQKLLEILESLSTKSKQLKSYSELVINHLLPSLLDSLNSNIDTRFRCLKIFYDICIPFMFDEEIFDPSNLSKFSTKLMNEVLVKKLIPMCYDLIEDIDPIPLYCIKLISYILERCPEYINVIKSNGLIGSLLSHFNSDDQKLSMHLMQIVKKFVSCEDMTLDEVIQLKLVQKVNSVLEYVVVQDWCVEITLDILYELLFAITSRFREKASNGLHGLADNLVLCTQLLQSEDDSVSEKTAHCLLLILQLFGTHLAQTCSPDQGKALLQILGYNKTGLQRVTIKTLKGVLENTSVPGTLEKIIPLRRHENEEIARTALEIQNFLKIKSKS